MTTSADGRACEEVGLLIDDFVDGTLTDDERSRVERHLAACPSCEAMAGDLAQIRRLAAALSPRRPRSDAWQQLSHRIRAEQPTRVVQRSSVWTRTHVGLAAAAVLLLAVAPGVWFLTRGQAPATLGGAPAAAPATTAAGTATPAASAVHPEQAKLVNSIDDELKAAEAHYEKAIAGLEVVAKANQEALDPELTATLQRNMGVIDQAIRDSRTAMQSQPSSQLAQDSLFNALQRKVNLLEDTIALINVMRKGDQAGTAKIVQGSNKT
jgi:anti-sigma factor RsiW